VLAIPKNKQKIFYSLKFGANILYPEFDDGLRIFNPTNFINNLDGKPLEAHESYINMAMSGMNFEKSLTDYVDNNFIREACRNYSDLPTFRA